MPSPTGRDLPEAVRRLTAVGLALSAEKDESHLMELILRSAMDLTGADGGTLYRRIGEELAFEIVITRSLNLHLGGTSGRGVAFPPLPLEDADGGPNRTLVAAWAAAGGRTVNVPDAYDAEGFDFSGTRAFDERMGYRSQSFLTVPMRDHEDEVIGVLQLINARSEAGHPEVFDAEDELLVEALSSQAAVALTQRRLLDGQRRLFEALVQLVAGAIDRKSPYTGGHCRRVPALTLMLADAAARTTQGPLAGFSMSEDDRYELEIAAWLHDCGKITTPEWVVDKATKLETIYDRIRVVGLRFELLKRDAVIRDLRDRLRAAGLSTDPGPEVSAEIDAAERDRRFLERVNLGGEFLAEADAARIETLSKREWTNEEGRAVPLLDEDEVRNLLVARGTLNDGERAIINHHITATIEMLEALPYPKHLARVPEFAGGHHERMDGTGYPRGLTRDEMSVQARIMGIADVFEALTAADRPYKPPMKVSEALAILARMKREAHVDPDLFDLFVRARVYDAYAKTYLAPEQRDEVDLDEILAADPRAEEEAA